MLGFALGRSIEFKDTKTVNQLTQTLLDHNFDPYPWIFDLVYSYPFRFKKSDPVEVDDQLGD